MPCDGCSRAGPKWAEEGVSIANGECLQAAPEGSEFELAVCNTDNTLEVGSQTRSETYYDDARHNAVLRVGP